MISVQSLINHSDCIISITDNAFTFGIKNKFLTAENILSCSFNVCLKVTCRTNISPFYIVSFTEFSECLSCCKCKWFENLWEILAVGKCSRMLCINVKTSCTADNNKPCICTGNSITKSFQRCTVLWENIFCPCTECVA